jgi:hypothetical protein
MKSWKKLHDVVIRQFRSVLRIRTRIRTYSFCIFAIDCTAKLSWLFAWYEECLC